MVDLIKLPEISGLCNKKNDLIFFRKKNLNSCDKLAIFFGGDLQNYEEIMKKNKCTNDYSDWCLENTLKYLGEKLPDYAILAIKCSEMRLNRFATYNNFLELNDDELIKFKKDFDCLQHLQQLIENLKSEFNLNLDYKDLNLNLDEVKEIILIGFSKGCSVLNQLIISLNELNNEIENANKRQHQNLNSSINENNFNNSLSSSFTDNKIFFDILSDALNKRLKDFCKKINKIIWLDSGFNEENEEVYILEEEILENLIKSNIEIQVHCTPYQIKCQSRPYIGEQEKKFFDLLTSLNAKLKRKFYSESSSINYHFELLKNFDPL